MGDGGAMTWTSPRAEAIAASPIRAMQTRCTALHGSKAIHLAAGFPEFSPPQVAVNRAARAIAEGVHQYAPPVGAPVLRGAVARRIGALWDRPVDPDTEVTICCGTTEGIMAALLATVEPNDEVLVFEPAYENYCGDIQLCGAHPRPVRLRPPDWRIDAELIEAALTPAVRAIVLNFPHNPTGGVLERTELDLIAELCIRHGMVAICDEVYETFAFERPHTSIASLPGMADHAITVQSASKTYALPGWRVGWIVAHPGRTAAIRRVHDLLTLGAPHPLQLGVAAALSELSGDYYAQVCDEMQGRRDLLVGGLRDLGFEVVTPDGSFFALAGLSELGFGDDVEAAEFLIDVAGVSSIPITLLNGGSAFRPGWLRLAFSRDTATLRAGLAAMREALETRRHGRGRPRSARE
jgi:aspartate/methionine/tyrosine aminotransferase